MDVTEKLARKKAELVDQRELLSFCITTLEEAPEDEELQKEVETAEGEVAQLEAEIANLESQKAAAEAATPPPPPPKTASPAPLPAQYIAAKSASPIPAPPPAAFKEPITVFNVNDTVQAKYSVDKLYYPATIITKTGSTENPIYKVKFHGYDEYETKTKLEVKSSGKRKAEPDTPAPVIERKTNGPVISAAPSIDMSKMNRPAPSMVSDGPTREKPAAKKLKKGKVMEENKNSWQDFTKNIKKVGNKGGFTESQFRTDAGQPKKKTAMPQPKRERVRYRPSEEDQ